MNNQGALNMAKQQPALEPTHHVGTRRGEEMVEDHGKEPGRHQAGDKGAQRPVGKSTPRDSTGINPDDRRPVHPDSVFIPPA
jgi:hypothetical protein